MLTRRIMIAGLAAAGAAGLSGSASAQSTNAEALAKVGPLGDVVVGSPDAKVTIIEYASLTCSHCANFHVNTYPKLKEKYIDTGKVKFILREFPLDPLATAGFMLARCNGNERYEAITSLLMEQQKNWAFVEKPLDALFGLAKQAGFTQESAEACLQRQDLYDAVNAVKNNGAEALAVTSTPTFFINGQKRTGALTIAELDQILTPLVGG